MEEKAEDNPKVQLDVTAPDYEGLWRFRPEPNVVEFIGDRETRVPEKKRKLWTRSREVKVSETEWRPLLVLMAYHQVPEFDEKTMEAYWRDREWTNESFDNVAIRMLEPEREAKPGRLRSGTAEYHKQWREKNKDRLRLYYRMRQRDMREVYKKAKEGVLQEKVVSPEEAAAIEKGNKLFEELGIK